VSAQTESEASRRAAPSVPREPIRRVVVRLQVGQHRMAATDDPVFLRLLGPAGREFRLDLAHGKPLRRGAENVFVLGAPGDEAVNVAHPELNDPTAPPLGLDGIQGVALWKGVEPLPNVRGLGEMDDRLQVESIEVELHVQGRSEPVRHARTGPIWLGLLCGHGFEVPRVDEAA